MDEWTTQIGTQIIMQKRKKIGKCKERGGGGRLALTSPDLSTHATRLVMGPGSASGLGHQSRPTRAPGLPWPGPPLGRMNGWMLGNGSATFKTLTVRGGKINGALRLYFSI
jgi:hypothetical protein